MINFSDYNDFFLFLSGLLIFGVIIYLFFLEQLQKIFISEQEISRLKVSNQPSDAKISLPRISVSLILLIIIIAGFLFNQFQMWKLNLSSQNKQFTINISITKKNAK